MGRRSWAWWTTAIGRGRRGRERGCRLIEADDDPEAEFDALQNAPVLAGAERYYRTMVRADAESWNVRDCHMDTLDRVIDHHGRDAKAVVWEHKHVGDARATDMAAAGMVNVGQIARKCHGTDDVVLVGSGSHHGSVIAAASWSAQMPPMEVPPAPPGTHEGLLHHANVDSAVLVFGDRRDTPWLAAPRGHRAIGVVYGPSDRRGNWVRTTMGRRYDAFCYFGSRGPCTPWPSEPATGGEGGTYVRSAPTTTTRPSRWWRPASATPLTVSSAPSTAWRRCVSTASAR